MKIKNINDMDANDKIRLKIRECEISMTEDRETFSELTSNPLSLATARGLMAVLRSFEEKYMLQKELENILEL